MSIQELNVYVVLLRDGNVLLLQRKNGIWEFPGGGVDWGENPKKAAVREVKEETGLKVDLKGLLGATSSVYRKGRDKKHSVYLVYSGVIKGGRLRLSKEHKKYRWVKVRQMGRLKLGYNVRPTERFVTRSHP